MNLSLWKLRLRLCWGCNKWDLILDFFQFPYFGRLRKILLLSGNDLVLRVFCGLVNSFLVLKKWWIWILFLMCFYWAVVMTDEKFYLLTAESSLHSLTLALLSFTFGSSCCWPQQKIEEKWQQVIVFGSSSSKIIIVSKYILSHFTSIWLWKIEKKGKKETLW